MSTAARVVSPSCDLDDSVFASRLSSCIRKSRRRPAGSRESSTRRLHRDGRRGGRAPRRHPSCARTARAPARAARGRASTPSCAMRSTMRSRRRCETSGSRARTSCDLRAHRRAAAEQQLADALAFAWRVSFSSRSASRSRSSAAASTGATSSSASRTTPGQRSKSSGLTGAASAMRCAPARRARGAASSSARVELERALRASGAISGTDWRRPCRGAAPRRWPGARRCRALEVFGQPQRDLQIAVIDSAQFADERAPRTLSLAPCEACHAADHCPSPSEGIKANAVLRGRVGGAIKRRAQPIRRGGECNS